ncbi:hypothetical protein F5146DRAFT_1028311 [Armillaria mellea]|nr:hypothetical protein F5146DRAFT_1028311 [Armillaria mellea]
MQKLTVQLGEEFHHFGRIFELASSLTRLDITLHTTQSACHLFTALFAPQLLPQLQSLKVVCIAWEAYHKHDDAMLGTYLTLLFLSRYMTFAADIQSVHVEVVLGGKIVANPLQPYERTPNGPFLSEPFWKSFERNLSDAPELRSRMVTEKKERCAIIRVNPAII